MKTYNIENLSIEKLMAYKTLFKDYQNFYVGDKIPLDDLYKVQHLLNKQISKRLKEFIEVNSDG